MSVKGNESRSVVDFLKAGEELMLQIDRDGTILSLFEDSTIYHELQGNGLRGKSLQNLFGIEQSAQLKSAISEALADGQCEKSLGSLPGQSGQVLLRFMKVSDNALIALLQNKPYPQTREQETPTALEFKDILETMPEVIYKIDLAGIINYISPSIEKLLGFTQSEVIGMDVRKFVSEEDDAIKNRDSHLNLNREYAGDLNLRAKDGNHKWVRFSATAFYSNGVLAGSIGTIIDITDKKNYELALEASEKKYRLLAENASDVIWLYNLTKGKFTYMSPSVLQLRGLTPEDAMGRKIDEGLSPASAEQVRNTIREALADKDVSVNAKRRYLNEIQILTGEGSLMWIETSTHYEINENGEIEIIGVTRNIDDRKKAELELEKYSQELKESETLFFTIFNESPVAMILSDPVTKVILDVNKKLTTTLGIQKEDLVSRPFFNLGLDIHDSRAIELGRRLSLELPVRDFEVRVTTPKGNVFDFLLTVERVKLGDSNRLLTTAIEITERKKGEQRISRMLDQEKMIADISRILNQTGDLKDLLNSTVRLVGIHTGVGRVFIYAEPDGTDLAYDFYEWHNENLLPEKWNWNNIQNRILSECRNQVCEKGLIKADNINELPDFLRSELVTDGAEAFLCFQLTSGSNKLGFIGFIEYGMPRTWLPDEIDLLRIVSGIISNAIQRKRIVEKMELSNLRLNLAIESASEGLWDINYETNQVYTNDRCYMMLGYEKDELSFDSQSLWNYIHPEDRKKVAEAYEKHFTGETEFYNAIYRLRAKDNSYRWILDHGQVVKKSSEGKPLRFLGTRLDINEQKETEVRLQQLVETQDKLFSIIAHDLRGPIGSFSQGIELLTSGRIKDEKLTTRLLEELKKTSQYTFRLLENLLNWSITKSNTMSIDPEPLRLKQLIEENLKLLAAYTLQKSISITVEADDTLTAYADRDSVNLVLRNLLNNAVKFTPTQGSVKISAMDSGKQIKLQVADTGVGMSRDILDSLFKIHSLNSSPGTNMEKGAGIGLVLCKDIVERNGGSIWAESTPGSGSRFWFTLPRYS